MLSGLNTFGLPVRGVGTVFLNVCSDNYLFNKEVTHLNQRVKHNC